MASTMVQLPLCHELNDNCNYRTGFDTVKVTVKEDGCHHDVITDNDSKHTVQGAGSNCVLEDKLFQVGATLDHCHSDCGLEILLVHSFKHLMRMYSSQLTDSAVNPNMETELKDPPIIVAGGLQQFLIRNMKKTQNLTQQPRHGAGSDILTFHDLPDNIYLKIFSYLSVRELCQASTVCSHWYCLASDKILWQRRLENDINHWDVISHTTNPKMYKECQSDWTNKEIYLRCSPEVNRILKQTYLSFHPLTNILRAFWPKKTPRIAMFGPGLESGTSQIVRNILEDKSGVFKTAGMFPGQFEGMGSGFTIKMSSISFHLITLYTSTRKERESRPRHHRLQNSRLLQQAAPAVGQPNADGQINDGESSDDEDQYEVRKPVQDLCAAVDGFIYVLDAGLNNSVDSSLRTEFRAMINDKWVPPSIPVAVMSCISEGADSRVSCSEIVDCLKLSRLGRPWQVRDCDVQDMNGVTDAIEWVVDQAQRSG